MTMRPRAKRAVPARASKTRGRLGPSTRDLVIVSRTLSDLAEFLERRQESAGRGRVILDRRVEERRRRVHTVADDRRQTDRRRGPFDPTEALMRVLGFMVVPAGVSPTNSRDGHGNAPPARAPRAPRRARRSSRHRARRRPA
jgi:hypothetical protein